MLIKLQFTRFPWANNEEFMTVDDPRFWDDLRAPFIDKLMDASRTLEKMRASNEAAIQAELTALAFEMMANKRKLSSLSLSDDEVDHAA